MDKITNINNLKEEKVSGVTVYSPQGRKWHSRETWQKTAARLWWSGSRKKRKEEPARLSGDPPLTRT